MSIEEFLREARNPELARRRREEAQQHPDYAWCCDAIPCECGELAALIRDVESAPAIAVNLRTGEVTWL